jgi:ABC-type nitrate/sulfonate/bicarbonate transport system substrate-binding protein
MLKKVLIIILAITTITFNLAGCTSVSKPGEDNAAQDKKSAYENQENQDSQQPRKITLLLDWVPNTNHTGLYVAKDKGYYAEEGMEVNIIQPTEGGSADLIAANQGEFGISYQEQVTYARTAENPLPVKAIAAIIQHNTSGFASPAKNNIKTPSDFEGKKYGGWGSPMEEAILKGLMNKAGADFSTVKMVDMGAADFFTATQKDVDFAWIYYGWDGVTAEVRNVPVNFIKLQDVDPKLDFYTPVIVAHEELLKNEPELAKKFLNATAKGYKFAIENPEEAVDSLLKYVPEIDKNIAIPSQKYLAKEYISDAKRWGEMKGEIWENYGNWMYDNGLMNKKLDVTEAYTNEFLPE